MGSGRRGVLVDSGLPGREVERRLASAGLGPECVEAVVVTHEHRDHVSGVGVWARRYRVPVYATESCRASAPHQAGRSVLDRADVRTFETGRSFQVAGLEFLPMATSHDAEDSVGFRITDGSTVLGFATDLGFASHLVRHALQGAHLLYLESNHDEERLLNGPYPWPLKQRILSRHGHLSNGACAALLANLLHPGLKALVLGHLSETNNEPRLAFEASRGVLAASGAGEDVLLLVARQDRPGRLLEVNG